MAKVDLVKRAPALLVSVMFTLATVAGSMAWLPATASAFAGGDGQTADTAWQIANCTQLQSLNDEFDYFDDFFELTASFSCSGIVNFDPIDFGSSVNFSGTLDGGGFTISDLSMDATSSYSGLFIGLDVARVFDLNFSNATVLNDDQAYTGLLAAVSINSIVSNITVEDSEVNVINDSNFTGGLFGESTGSTISGIDAEILVHVDSARGSTVGGLIGRSLGDQISNVTVRAGLTEEDPQVEGDENIGGLIGFAEATGMENITSNAFVSGSNGVGGIVGTLSVNDDTSKEITGTTSTGEVYGLQNGGGTIGQAIDNDSEGVEFQVSDSYATGQVSGYVNIGGFIGRNTAAEIYESYATGNVVAVLCECAYLGGFVGLLDDDVNTEGYIHESFATGDVDILNEGTWDSGGFVGYMANGRIENAYARGDVAAYAGSGGFVSFLGAGTIENVYSTGLVLPADASSGLVRNIDTGNVYNSFWDIETSGQGESEGGTGLTTDQATSITPYQDAGWDFTEVPIWSQVLSVNDGYPCLYFEEDCNEGEAEINEEDLNGDNIPDIDQPNVGGYVSSFTGKTVAIDVGDGCELTTDDMTRESSLDVQDAAYDYDNGLWEFEAECAEGATTTIKMYYYDIDPTDLVLRKHNDITGAYFNVPGAIITTQTIDGNSVAVVTYQISDNGDLDLEKEAVGMIRDPAGLGRSLVGAPNTGLRR